MELLDGQLAIDAEQLWLGYAALARLQRAQSCSEQALATLDAFLQVAHQRHVAPLLLAQAAALRARLELARGDLLAARHWAASLSDPGTRAPGRRAPLPHKARPRRRAAPVGAAPGGG